MPETTDQSNSRGRSSGAGRVRILLAEDEQLLRESLADLLEDEGYEVLQAEHGGIAHQIILEQDVDLVLTDVRMPEVDGLTLVDRIKRAAPETPVIVITAFGTVDDAVQAMRSGAWDYLRKPVQFEDLLVKVRRAIEYQDLTRSRRMMVEQLAEGSGLQAIVSEAPSMLALFEQIRKLSTVMSSVLIVGESGTGKELVAKAIHYTGVTRDKPFIPVNCGAIPESLIESELFGHRKGSFTGAIRDKKGLFEEANCGTIFLDEIATLPLHVQGTLLRVLEDRKVLPVGDTKPRPINLRVVAASNQDIEKMAAEETFRSDLLYRLNVVKLVLPPLRMRKGDIPLLANHFLDQYMRELNRDVRGFTNGAMRAMLTYDWPGNIRELKNVIERAVIFAEGREITVDDMPFQTSVRDDEITEDLRESLRLFERQHIISCLKRHRYDKAAAARHLGIGVSSLYRKMDELEIPKSEDGADD